MTVGLTLETLDTYGVSKYLQENIKTQERKYTFYFSDGGYYADQQESAQDNFTVVLLANTGFVENCMRYASPGRFTLPEGPLYQYWEAVCEFLDSGSFEELPSEEKADVAKRISETSFGEYRKDIAGFVSPEEGDISEETAIACSKKALLEEYGISEEHLSMFNHTTSCVTNFGERVWCVEFFADPYGQPYFPLDISQKLGKYTVYIRSSDQAVQIAYWSHHIFLEDQTCTEHNWAQLDWYGPEVLPYVYDLLTKVNEMEESDAAFTLEGVAARDQLFRDAGFSVEEYPHALPEKEELSYEEALAFAREVLMAEYELTKEAVLSYDQIHPYFVRIDSENPVWGFALYCTAPGKEDYYEVEINAKTDEVLRVTYLSGGNG